MKRLFVTLIAILSCSAAFAEQSEAQAQWVPTHEFHIDLFGGYSSLNYQIDPNFLKTKSNFTDNLAGGAGFGYTWHLNDWFGITTGAEFALYRGGFTATDRAIGFTKLYYDPNTNLNVFSAVSWTDITYIDEPGSVNHTVQWNDVSFSERQTVYSAQIPLMVQFMAPLNARKSHHFYAAVGARVGFNFLGTWNRTGVSGTTGNELQKCHSVGYDIYSFTQYFVRNADVHMQNEGYAMSMSVYKDGAGNIIPVKDVDRTMNAAIFSGNPYNPNVDTEPVLEGSGKMNLNLLQVLASAELGFRWGLGNGFGLYTGLYIDYGFLPMLKGGKNPVYDYAYTDFTPTSAAHHTMTVHNGSMLECVYDDPKVSTADGMWSWPEANRSENIDIASKLGNLGAGLKLKFAFGSTGAKAKAEPEPVIQYVERIVRDTVTVVKKDTIVNTVVQKDTVVNTVIQHDTVTVIKEVPVEIQKVMADLSNSLFDTGKAIIKDDAKGPLYTVVMWLKANPDAKVEVSGHTDNVGGAVYNQKLSEARAKAVYEYFISKGVSAERLSYAGYGMDRPIATNDTPEGRQQNRRVELNVIE